MGRLLIFALVIMTFFQAGAADEPVAFTEWKSQQIQKSQFAIEKARSEVLKNPVQKTITAAKSLQLQLDQAKELTVSDYFAGYVLNFAQDRTMMVKLVQKLSPDETAQIMQMFAKNLMNQQQAKNNRAADRMFFE